MQLLEAIIDANHRAVAGDAKAGIHVAEYAGQLPLIALTCIDPRLNRLFPGALALPEQHFVWSRNAGNIIFGPMSTMMRSLALGCAVKGGREIAIIGHTDCLVRHTSEAELIQRFNDIGIARQQMPEDLKEFFGTFNDERDNVIKSVNFVRHSPLIGPRIPVHGLMIDTATGRLEWVVNGYDVLAQAGTGPSVKMPELGGRPSDLSKLGSFNIGEMKFPEQKIGEVSTNVGGSLPELRSETLSVGEVAEKKAVEQTPAVNAPPPAIRVPPPIPGKQTSTGSWRAKR
jgi:carbonic anhydrase